MPGAQCTRGLAWKKINHTSVVTTGPPESPDIPARNGFNSLFSCSPRRSGFLVTVVCASSRRLDAGVEASGPHDFAVRRTAPSSLAPPASTASRSAFATIMIRPSVGRDGESSRSDLGCAGTEIFSEKQKKGLDRQKSPRLADFPVGQITSPVRCPARPSFKNFPTQDAARPGISVQPPFALVDRATLISGLLR
jgi:hypothetical protein